MMEPRPFPGMRAFDSLHAEDEAAWLEAIFHRPECFTAMSMNRSLVLFGSSGSGKTAVRLRLEALCAPDGQKPNRLTVQWVPPIPFQGQSKNEIIQEVMSPVYDACAQAILAYIGRYPQAYQQAKGWAQDSLRAFIACFLAQDYAFLISQMEDQCTPEGFQLLRGEIRRPVEQMIYAQDMPISKIITLFAAMIAQFQVKGVWVMIDGIEGPLEFQREEIIQSFHTFFSTLAIFENNAFAFKIMLPAELLPALSQCPVIRNRRVTVVRLDEDIRDTPDYLRMIVEKHLAHAVGAAQFPLRQLVEQPGRLLRWLDRFVDPTPRAWLELTQALLRAYLAQSEPGPLSPEALSEVLNPRTPRLRIDQAKQQILIGRMAVSDIQPAAWKILLYLYKNKARLCTREEIYYLGYQELDTIPKQGDARYQSPNEWRGTLDTALYRLRLALEGRTETEKEEAQSAVEEDGDNPYLTTYRRKGVRLDHVE